MSKLPAGEARTPELDMTVGEILGRWPEAAAPLARLGLDLCCGGVHPLRMAAVAHGKDPEAVLAEVRAALRAGGRA
jgi:iron-sulfur cluster repair protein YtfE (RIC family)